MRSARRGWVLFVVLAAFAGAPLAQTPAGVQKWGTAAAGKLGAHIPSAPDGLVDELPWEVHVDYPALLSGCLIGCLQFSPLSAERKWRVADPALVSAQEAAAATALADAVALTAKFGTIPAEEFARQQRAIEQRTAVLEKRGRSVVMTIQGNLPLQPSGMEGRGTPAGTLQGLPLVRFEFTSEDYAPTTRGIRYAVFLGPAGFQNPKVKDTMMRGELRAISVSVSVQTLPERAALDDALIRQLLEAVDYGSLRKLIQ